MGQPGIATRPRVLVLEDDDCVLRLLTFLLESEGFEVSTAVDGDEALHRFAADSPSLLLLDVMVPKINGIEVCRTVRQNSGVPVIILTALSENRWREEAIEAGASKCLPKPFDCEELIRHVRELLVVPVTPAGRY